jgi:hypothetical protein
VEAPRKHRHAFDMRWPCARTESPRAVPLSEPGYGGLHLVTVESIPDPEPQEAGTQRLLAAMAAARASDKHARRNPWL